MGSTGNLSLIHSTAYLDASQDMNEVVNTFEANAPQKIINAVRQYAFGTYGDENAKAQFDDVAGLSQFIDTNTRLKVDGTLYRGVVLSDKELSALQVGKSANIKGLTSWSGREMVAHMYATGDDMGNTMGDKTGNAVVFIDANTKDAIVMPYTYPQAEALRSKNITYEVTKIVSQNEYIAPVGRKSSDADYYTAPVTYVYVKHRKMR